MSTHNRRRCVVIAGLLALVLVGGTHSADAQVGPPPTAGFCPGATLGVTPSPGQPGDPLVMAVSNWPAGETIRLEIVGNGEMLTVHQGATTESDFTRFGTVPAFDSGTYMVEASLVQPSSLCATAPLVIEGPPAPTTTTTTTTVPVTTSAPATTAAPTTTAVATTTAAATTTSGPATTETATSTRAAPSTSAVVVSTATVAGDAAEEGSGSSPVLLIGILIGLGAVAIGFGWWLVRRRDVQSAAEGEDGLVSG